MTSFSLKREYQKRVGQTRWQDIYKGINKFRAGDTVFLVEQIKKATSHFYSFMFGSDDMVFLIERMLE